MLQAAYAIFLHEAGEDFLVGQTLLNEAHVEPNVVEHGRFKGTRLDYEYHIRSKHCSKEPGYTISKCVKEFLDKTFDNCSLENQAFIENCTDDLIIQRFEVKSSYCDAEPLTQSYTFL